MYHSTTYASVRLRLAGYCKHGDYSRCSKGTNVEHNAYSCFWSVLFIKQCLYVKVHGGCGLAVSPFYVKVHGGCCLAVSPFYVKVHGGCCLAVSPFYSPIYFVTNLNVICAAVSLSGREK